MLEIIPMNHRNRQLTYNPFKEFENFEKLFFGEPFFGSRTADVFGTDIREDDDGYVLEADLPGFDKKDISIDLTDDYLTIKAERKSESEEGENKRNYISRERSFGSYTRRFEVSGIDTDKISAKYENGVLSLKLPRKEPKEPASRQLTID